MVTRYVADVEAFGVADVEKTWVTNSLPVWDVGARTAFDVSVKYSAAHRKPQSSLFSLFWRFGVLAVQTQGAVLGAPELVRDSIVGAPRKAQCVGHDMRLRGAMLDWERPNSRTRADWCAVSSLSASRAARSARQ